MKLSVPGLVRAALMVATMTVPPAATAQKVTMPAGARQPQAINDEGQYSGAKARLVMEGFARCVVARHRAAVLRAVSLPPMSVDENKALGKLVDDDCLRNGDMNFGPTHFRGALYTRLYRERFGAGVGAVNTAPVDFSWGTTPDPASPAAQAVAKRKFVDCAVRRRPDAAHQIIVGKAGTDAENTGFSALLPDLTACIAKDARIRFTKTDLEGLIAEVLYLDTASPASLEAGK